MLGTQLGSGYESHGLDLLEDFRSCRISEVVRGNALKTSYPIALYRSSDAKATSDVLSASLNNSGKY
jgi:hypothetical protein